jgi:hypothetical protein
MQRKRTSMRGREMAYAVVVTCLAAAGATAQSFESAFGEPNHSEQAGRRAIPVQACGGGGFIATGIIYGQPVHEVYLVRIDATGGSLWERAYRVESATLKGGGGASVVELADGSGFVIGGATASSAINEDVFLMKVDCDGKRKWLQQYTGAGLEVISDMIQAANGDLIAAGYASNPAGDLDGLLLRANSVDGTLIWSQRYDQHGGSEWFRALIETRGRGQTRVPDIVAVGQTTPVGGVERAFVVRVSGTDGQIGAAPQCAATYGGLGERFRSVTELRVGALAGQLVMAGYSNSPETGHDIYLLRTRANPCVPRAQRRVGDPATGPLGEEDAYDVREVRTGVQTAVLALTGSAGNAAGTDAFLLRVGRQGLNPIAGSGRLFGNHAGGREVGFSVARAAVGFLIAGSSNTDFQLNGDLNSLYVVKTDAAGHTPCDLSWDPPARDTAFRRVPAPLALKTALVPVPADWTRRTLDTPFPVCR